MPRREVVEGRNSATVFIGCSQSIASQLQDNPMQCFECMHHGLLIESWKCTSPAVFGTSRGTCAEMFSGVTIPMYLGTFPSDFPTSERQTAQTDFTVQDRFGIYFDARLVSYFDEGFSSKCNRFTPRNHGHRTIGTNRAESWSNLGKDSRLSLPGLQTFYANIIALRHSNEGVFQLVSTHNC